MLFHHSQPRCSDLTFCSSCSNLKIHPLVPCPPLLIQQNTEQAAHSAGIPVLLDAGGVDAPLSPELLQHVTLVSPNETELARLTGLPTASLTEVDAAARKLMTGVGGGGGGVLVKLGREGSMLLPGASATPIRQMCIPAPQVVDTTGAGDCFTAAFAVAVLEGMAPNRALLFASAAASLCVRKPGAMPSLPLRAEVDELLAGIGGKSK